MYKHEIRESLERLRIASGGALEGLLATAERVEEKVEAAVSKIAENSDASSRSGGAQLQEALRPVAQRLAEISPSSTVVEVHGLVTSFDAVLRDYPQMESILRPGRQAIAEFAGAFDVALQQNRRPPSLVGVVHAAAALRTCIAHYRGLLEMESIAGDRDVEPKSTIEAVGVERLEVFAAYIGIIADLAGIARVAAAQASTGTGGQSDFWIADIESGSPIQISFKGDGKALQLLLAMVRDLFGTPYRAFTLHGQVLQTMDTFARARDLGIDSEEVLAQLKEAMISTARRYSESFEDGAVAVRLAGGSLKDRGTARSVPEESGGQPLLGSPSPPKRKP